MSHRREPEQIKNHQLEELICQNRLIIRLLSIIRGDFEDAWSRYCPLPALQNATSPQPASTLNETAFSKRHTTHDVADAKSGANPHEHCTVAGVAVENPENLPLDESIFTNPARARR